MAFQCKSKERVWDQQYCRISEKQKEMIYVTGRNFKSRDCPSGIRKTFLGNPGIEIGDLYEVLQALKSVVSHVEEVYDG